MSNTGLYCSYCGQLNDAEAVFCSRCGARQRPISEGTSTGAGAAPVPPPASFQPATPTAPSAGQEIYGNATGPNAVGASGSAGYGAGGYGAAAAPGTYGAVPMYSGYGGFWLRVVAAIIDFIVVGIVVFPIRAILFGTTMLPGIMHGGEPNMTALMAGSMFGGLFHVCAAWLYEAGLE